MDSSLALVPYLRFLALYITLASGLALIMGKFGPDWAFKKRNFPMTTLSIALFPVTLIVLTVLSASVGLTVAVSNSFTQSLARKEPHYDSPYQEDHL